MSHRYSLRSGASQPSTSGPKLPPVQQNTDRDTKPPIGKVLGTLNSYQTLDDSRVPHSDRMWPLTANTDVGIRRTANGGWTVKKVTVGGGKLSYHGAEETLPHNSEFFMGEPAKGHHVYTIQHDEWMFHGINLGDKQDPSDATQQPAITTTEAGSGAGDSRTGMRK